MTKNINEVILEHEERIFNELFRYLNFQIMNDANRKGWLDAARGIAMCLVVLGHCGKNGNIIYNWLYYTHIPLFIIIAGYTFSINSSWKSKSIIENMLHKAKGIMYPYFVFGLIAFVVDYSNHVITKDPFKYKTIITLLFSFEHDVNWFLPILFFSSSIFVIAYKVLMKIFKNEKGRVFGLIALVLVSFILLTRVRNLFYDGGWNEKGELHSLLRSRYIMTLIVGRTLSFMPFIIIGYFIGLKEKAIQQLNKNITLIILILILGLTVYLAVNNPEVDMHFFKWEKSLFFCFVSLSSSVSIFILFMMTQIESSVLEYIGKNTLIINPMHSRSIANIKLVVVSFVKEYMPNMISPFTYAFFLIVTICLFIVPIFNKAFPFLLNFDLLVQEIEKFFSKFKDKGLKTNN